MKSCLTCLALLLPLYVFSQTHTGNVLLTSNAEIVTFGANNYTTINGNLRIIGTGISDLTPLATLTTINGNLDVGHYDSQINSNLTTFQGLHNIATVTGFAYFGGFDMLADLSGLAGLATVNGNLTFRRLFGLTTFAGFSTNLTAIGGGLKIEGLGDLNSLSGLSNIASIGGVLNIVDNSTLTSLSGLSASLTTIPGMFQILNNNQLTTLSGLPNIATVNGDCIVKNNGALTSLTGLGSLTSVSGDLILENNDLLPNLSGLGSLTSIGDELWISSNNILSSIAALSALTSIGSSITITTNSGLGNLTGFPAAITSVTGSFTLSNNSSLTDLSALSNLASISGSCVFSNNDAATSLSGLGNLATVGGNVTISGNAQLANLNGLFGLASAGSFTISQNTILSGISGMTSLTTVSGEMSLSGNAGLTSLTGLNSLTSLGSFNLQDNDALTSVSNFLTGVSSLSGNLVISHHALLPSFQGLTNLTSINDLSMTQNTMLSSISGLGKITTVNGQIWATLNNALTSFPFCNLGSIGTDLTVNGNPALTNVDAFYNVTSLNNLFVDNNISLSDCGGLCNLISNVSGSVSISGNATPCDNPTNVQNNCVPLPANDACSGATSLTLNSSGSCTSTTSGTTHGAMQTLAGCNFESCPIQDVWYSFTAVQALVKVRVSNIASGGTVLVEMFSGSCGGLNSLGVCQTFFNNDIKSFTGLTPGNNYFLRVYTDDFNGPSTFDICMQQVNPPANDASANAVNLTQAEICSAPVSGTVEDASESLPNTQMCNGAFAPTANDVWYKFTASTATATFSVETVTGIFSPVIELIDTDQSTFITCNYKNAPGTVELEMTGLTNGKLYYLRIFHGGIETLFGAEAQFSVCLHRLPSIELPQTFGGSCEVATVTHTSTGSGNWMHFEYNDRLLASVLDSETMGAFSVEIYTHGGSIRSNGDGVEVLHRNLELTPATQPSNPVSVRFYLTIDEFNSLVAANDGDNNDINTLSDFVAMRFTGTPCPNSPPNGGVLHPVTGFGNLGNNAHYLEVSIPAFSSFFFTGGASLLPVELTNFRANVIDQKVLLHWATAAEINNLGFEIQRSMDGVAFTKIGWKNGQGSNKATTEYQHEDAFLQPGHMYYYRLRQIDMDGHSTFSNTISATIGGKAQPRIYPNPASNFIFVEMNGEEGRFTFEIINLMGQTVKSYSFETGSLQQIDIEGLQNGVYEVLLKKEGRVIQRQRVVVSQ